MSGNHEAMPRTHVSPALFALMDQLARAAIGLAGRIARSGLDGHPGAEAGVNSDGDARKALDVMADDLFQQAARRAGVRHYASERQDRVIVLEGASDWALAIDPLNGASDIDANGAIGTIFSIFPAATTPEASFLRPAAEQAGAGYVIYGPQVALVCSFGQGVQRYVLDPGAGRFVLVEPRVTVPADSSEFAVNASNYRHWSKAIRTYVDDCLAGADGPRGKNFDMRWIASLVAEAHRILSRGGVFLYPSDARKGYENGRLQLVYECAPIAYLMVQAGGGATDGADPILHACATSLHERTPFVFGSLAKVARLAAYLDMPANETAALFGKRGLFRS
jgi:fructose-1,6-bisphosphatase I